MNKNYFLSQVLNQAKVEKDMIKSFGIGMQKCAILINSKKNIKSVSVETLCKMDLNEDFEVEFMHEVFEDGYGKNVIWNKSINKIIDYITLFLDKPKEAIIDCVPSAAIR